MSNKTTYPSCSQTVEINKSIRSRVDIIARAFPTVAAAIRRNYMKNSIGQDIDVSIADVEGVESMLKVMTIGFLNDLEPVVFS